MIMEDGVAYMMMGDGDDGTPTQLVALQSEDGTQQLAVPVIDPHTGQETYMILDQNALEGEDGQQLLIVGGEGDGVVDGEHGVHDQFGEEEGYTLGADQDGGVLMIPSSLASSMSGQNVVYVSGEGLHQVPVSQSLGSGGLAVPMKEGGMIHMVGVKSDNYRSQSVETPKVPVNRQPRKQNLAANSDYSQDYRPPSGLTGDIIKDTVLVDECVEMLCRRMTLSNNQKEDLRLSLMTHGLDFADTYLMKERKRGHGRGGAARKEKYTHRGRGRGRPKKSSKPRVIRCDQCQLEFPANTLESTLIQHVERFHMVKTPGSHSSMNDLDPDMPSGPPCYKCSDCSTTFQQIKPLLEHQKIVHSKNVDKIPESPGKEGESPGKNEVEKNPSSPPPSSCSSPNKQKVEVIKKLADEWDDEEDGDELGEETLREEIPREILDQKSAKLPGPESSNSSERLPTKASTALNGARPGSEMSETIEDITKEVEGIQSELRQGKDELRTKEELEMDKKDERLAPAKDEDDEDKIVADVDDILSDTDRLIKNDLPRLLSGKRKPTEPLLESPRKIPRKSELKSPKSDLLRTPETKILDPIVQVKPSVQCEECYECFEDDEKLAWHNLNDH
ncbi:uncharacterized protein LOC111717149 isoform X2 [Eurytemora carolleeae]|uniref:uncharacterized protein LOC111717149 isoform X2 n=1 Tax=Eurytemora carolleeae TaxID=1294199 RepID=UPI000C78A787|nr:uncharacterized protein LOC111717149 isoform X2 [Eurytemora carolleeae]|eukprot:XP_023348428.1 uncharacterized protein LOC111717149 isoform X2 [Eurytemora affinis]